LKITLTSALQKKIQQVSTLSYAFEITKNTESNLTHGAMTWTDVTYYVLKFPQIKLKQEYSFNEAQHSPSVKLVLSDVDFWVDYFNTTQNIEFRIRCTHKTVNDESVGTYTIFGGRIYADEVEYDYLSDEVNVTAYSYSENLNRIPLFQLATYYNNRYLSPDSETIVLTIDSFDATTAQKNLMGVGYFEYDSGSGYRWNQGLYSAGTTLYDFRSSPFGKLVYNTVTLTNGESIPLVAKYNHRGESVSTNIAFSTFKYSQFNRLIRAICLESGIDLSSIDWQRFIYPTYNNRATVSYIGSALEWNSDIQLSLDTDAESIYKIVQYDDQFSYVFNNNGVYKYDGNTGEYTFDSADVYIGGGDLGSDIKTFLDTDDGLIYFIDYTATGEVGFFSYDVIGSSMSAKTVLDPGSDSILYSWNYIKGGNIKGFSGLRRAGRSADAYDVRPAYYELGSATLYESAGIVQTIGASTYNIKRDEAGLATYVSDDDTLKFYIALTDYPIGTKKLIGVTEFAYGVGFSGSFNDYKEIINTGLFNYSTQNSSYSYFMTGTKDLPKGVVRFAISLSDLGIFYFVPDHESVANYSHTTSILINEITNDLTYSVVDLSNGHTYYSGRLSGSTFSEESIEDNKQLINSGANESDCGTSVGSSNYYGHSHWYFRIGRDFEPFLGSYDLSSGSLRDLVNDISKTYGISVNFNADKTVNLVSKFAYDKDYLGTGEILSITDDDIKSIERIDARRKYDFTKLTSGELIKISDNANVYTANIGGENVFNINTDLYVDVIAEDVVNIRHRTFNDTLFTYKVNLNGIYHFMDNYDILTISNSSSGINGNFVIIEVNCKQYNTELIICRYENNFALLETGDSILLETGDKIILEL